MLQHAFKEIQVPQMDVGGTVGNKEIPRGWVNTTAMCKPYGKAFADYARLGTTKAFWEALSAEMGIPITGLVITIQGGNDKNAQGTWVHPQIAIDLAGWLSPEFKVWATGTLMKIMYGIAQTQANPALPARVVALETAKAIAEIQQTLADFDARIAQILIDHAMQDIKALPSGEELPAMAGAVEIASDLGYQVRKEERSLGRHVAKRWREATKTEPKTARRECGGAFRPLKVYPRNSEVVIDAIKEYYNA